MDTETAKILLNYVIPSIGCVTSNMLAFSSLRTMLEISKTRRLGNYDPCTVALCILNAFAQIFYAFQLGDPFVFGGNFIPFLLNLWYLFIVTSCTDYNAAKFARTRKTVSAIIIAGSGMLNLGYFIVKVALADVLDETQRTFACGCISLFFLVAFYTSPLVTLSKVVRERDSSYFFMPLALACLVNGSLWFAYGLAKQNPFIYMPNVAGASVAVIQVICTLIFPSRAAVAVNKNPSQAGKSCDDADSNGLGNNSKNNGDSDVETKYVKGSPALSAASTIGNLTENKRKKSILPLNTGDLCVNADDNLNKDDEGDADTVWSYADRFSLHHGTTSRDDARDIVRTSNASFAFFE